MSLPVESHYQTELRTFIPGVLQVSWMNTCGNCRNRWLCVSFTSVLPSAFRVEAASRDIDLRQLLTCLPGTPRNAPRHTTWWCWERLEKKRQFDSLALGDYYVSVGSGTGAAEQHMIYNSGVLDIGQQCNLIVQDTWFCSIDIASIFADILFGTEKFKSFKWHSNIFSLSVWNSTPCLDP